MIFGQGLVSSCVEDVACRERLVGFCRHVHMIFGQGLVSSCGEDVACRERLVWVFGRGLVSSHVEVCI